MAPWESRAGGVLQVPHFQKGAGEPSSCPGCALSPWDSQPTGLTTLPPPHTLPTPPRCTPGHRPCPGPSRTPQLRHQAHLWGECSCAFLCNKSKCMCRCSVFLQTHLLGCYKIKTIFSLSKCFPSKSLEVHNSPAHLQLLFSWGYKEIMIVGPVSF